MFMEVFCSTVSVIVLPKTLLLCFTGIWTWHYGLTRELRSETTKIKWDNSHVPDCILLSVYSLILTLIVLAPHYMHCNFALIESVFFKPLTLLCKLQEVHYLAGRYQACKCHYTVSPKSPIWHSFSVHHCMLNFWIVLSVQIVHSTFAYFSLWTHFVHLS